jgi:hypothetical protein
VRPSLNHQPTRTLIADGPTTGAQSWGPG